VTRAAHQAAGLCRLIEEQGGRALRFPALEILPAADPQTARRLLGEARGLVVFVSPNAVEFARGMLPAGGLPAPVQVAAVGEATARALVRAGYQADLLPSRGFDSEGLLALPELQAVRGREVLIVRGEGGRALLGDLLRQRGARVAYAEVYRRGRPLQDPAALLARWERDVDLVTVTSNAVLHNLLAMLGSAGGARLRRTPLLVISERMRRQARALGFQQILLAEGASDQAIVQAICAWSGATAPPGQAVETKPNDD